MIPESLIALCRECAAAIYGTRAPSGRYAESVARLLMGTAAAESLLRYRRQIGFSDTNIRGAWGLCRQSNTRWPILFSTFAVART